MATKRWIQEHKQLGLCTHCNDAAVLGHTTCLRHAVDNAKIARRRRNKHKEQGLCTVCMAKSLPDSPLCELHFKARQLSRWIEKCKAVEILGGACVWCGQQDVRVLEFDHINNDGKKHRAESRIHGGAGTATWIIAVPEEAQQRIQVLCANCHAIKNYKQEGYI